MLHSFSRTELLFGKENMEKLYNAKVAIFGIGGVGTYAVEGLVRSGVGSFVLVDDDCICLTNINRQLHATRKSIGENKVDAMKNRILSINPKAHVETFKTFYMPGCSDELIKDDYDYIIDAIDTVTGKIDLVVNAFKQNIKIISSMGAGNKIDPTKFEVDDIYNTSVCPLARVMRKELKKREIPSLKVVYSKEKPMKPIETNENGCSNNCICPDSTSRKCNVKHQIPGSTSFVPSVVGLIIAGEVIKGIINNCHGQL